jgi:hypothetical protein
MSETPDTFAAAIALIGMAVDPKATSARLAELQKQIDAAAKGQAKLAADREQHATAVAADGSAAEIASASSAAPLRWRPGRALLCR